METDRIVWDAKTAFFDNLKYEFRYNESENTIDISYWFSSAIPEEAASIVRYVPHAHTVRYHPPKRRGRKPALDAIFDDPQKMLWVTRQAEHEFEQGLGQTIETALKLFIHLTMYRCGVLAWRETSKLMADLFAKSFRADIVKKLGVKIGRHPLFRDADHYRQTLQDCMSKAAIEGEITSAKQFTQEMAGVKVARKFNPDADAFDPRIIRQWNKDYDLPWRKFLNEAWKKLTREN